MFNRISKKTTFGLGGLLVGAGLLATAGFVGFGGNSGAGAKIASADNQTVTGDTFSVESSDICKTGLVWREAVAGDHVCVSTLQRDQAAKDNAAANSRKAANNL